MMMLKKNREKKSEKEKIKRDEERQKIQFCYIDQKYRVTNYC